MMLVNASFVLQNGEGGPVIEGVRMVLRSEDLPQCLAGSYWSEYVVPLVVRRLIEDKNERVRSGKLWEGAYLVTHPDDANNACSDCGRPIAGGEQTCPECKEWYE